MQTIDVAALVCLYRETKILIYIFQKVDIRSVIATRDGQCFTEICAQCFFVTCIYILTNEKRKDATVSVIFSRRVITAFIVI